jgi:hypothetical protein
VEPETSLHGFQQSCGIEAEAIAEDRLNILNIVDVAARIPLDHHEVSVFANGDGTDMIGLAETSGPIESGILIASTGVNPLSTKSSISR